MSIEIRIIGLSADEALTELKTFSAGLLECTARTSATHADVDSGYAEAVQTEDHQEGETEEQHGERVKRKRRTKAEMEAARAAEASAGTACVVDGGSADAVTSVNMNLGTGYDGGGAVIVGVDPAVPGGDKTAEVLVSIGADALSVVSIKEDDPFPPSDDPKTTAGDFATAYAAYKEANPDKDEGAFLRAELQKLVDKIGMDAAREFMVANGYGAVSKIKPEERTAFLTAVYGKLAE